MMKVTTLSAVLMKTAIFKTARARLSKVVKVKGTQASPDIMTLGEGAG